MSRKTIGKTLRRIFAGLSFGTATVVGGSMTGCDEVPETLQQANELLDAVPAFTADSLATARGGASSNKSGSTYKKAAKKTARLETW